MAKQERRSSRGSSFGKRQKADDDFRKKKSEGRTGFKGSSYEGGKRKFSDGGGNKRSDDRRSDDRRGGERKSFGEKRSFDKKPYRSGRPSGSGPRDFGDKKPYRSNRFSDRSESGEGRRGPRQDGDQRRSSRPGGFRNSDGPRRNSRPGGFRKDSEGPRRSSRPGNDRNDRRGRFNENREKPDRRERPERRSFVEAKVQSHRERVEEPAQGAKNAPAKFQDPNELIRLNKFISNSGVCSRREADELIKMGLITVNGTTITEMGHKVKPTDDVRHDGKRLTAERPVYILLNKPKGFITTTDDPQERNTVMQLVAGACKERVYPVGRLDRNTTGLLLLTNDGELTEKLTHPSFNAKKIYKAELDKPLTKADFQKIVEGVSLEEGKAMVDDLAIVSDDNKTVGIELHIGWNHVVRRIFNALEYDVVKLDRVVYAGLDKTDLKRGQWRFLKSDEIVRLKHFK